MTHEDKGAHSDDVAGDADEPHARRYELYLEDRNSKLALDAEQSKFIDGAILSLGGGALALLLTYLHGLGAPPVDIGLVQIGAIALVLSIVLALGSVFASQLSIERYIVGIDAEAERNFAPPTVPNPHRNFWVGATARLNLIAFVCLIVGIVAASGFAVVNMPLESAIQRSEPSGEHAGLRKDSETASGRGIRAGRSDQTAPGRAATGPKANGQQQQR